jgi:hypothetical protein
MNFLTPSPLQIDPEWMTDALRRAGAIRGARVVGMTCDPVGNGLVGDSYRFGLTRARCAGQRDRQVSGGRSGHPSKHFER